METITIDLEHCYGIKKLTHKFEFGDANACAIYAPNGAMKSSLAKTFQDIADGKSSGDRVFPSRANKRRVSDAAGVDLDKACVLVVQPYDEVLGQTERTATLLVNAKLRSEYEKLHEDIDTAKATLLTSLREQSRSKRDFQKEIALAFTQDENEFDLALGRIKDELKSQTDTPFADVNFDIVFDEKVLAVLGTKDFKSAIKDYITKYNELLAASTYFRKGIFNYHHASTIAKSLADNGFFKAKHSLRLNAETSIEIADEKELEKLIAKEKDQIASDADLKKKYAELDKVLKKNVTVRGFEDYLGDHEEILPELSNIDLFKQKVLKSYLKKKYELYLDLIDKIEKAAKRKAEIQKAAAAERTQWEEVIDVFNSRFFVPFKLFAKNREAVMLGQEAMLSLGFRFEDGTETATVDRTNLIAVLSTGEKKALYILNVIFEIEARRTASQKTLLVVDDIADSFDYKNKYAIIQYLMEIAESSNFKQLLLTHNFDFFRTVASRFVPYNNCHMAHKTSGSIELSKAFGIKNIFVNDWKKNFYSDAKKRIATIPFMRNLVEFTQGESNATYLKLTSLLHWKADTPVITQADLDTIYVGLFGGTSKWANPSEVITDIVFTEADGCLGASTGMNFENKVILSLAARLWVERFMIEKINDPVAVATIKANQTVGLLKKYIACSNADGAAIKVIQRVILMTPENIHLNSFMYEPILDMSDDHLKALYRDAKALS